MSLFINVWQTLLLPLQTYSPLLPGHMAAQLENIFPEISCKEVWPCDKVLLDVGNVQVIYKNSGLVFPSLPPARKREATGKLGKYVFRTAGLSPMPVLRDDFTGQSTPSQPPRTVTSERKKLLLASLYFAGFFYKLTLPFRISLYYFI